MIGFDIVKVAELIKSPDDHVMSPMVAIGKDVAFHFQQVPQPSSTTRHIKRPIVVWPTDWNNTPDDAVFGVATDDTLVLSSRTSWVCGPSSLGQGSRLWDKP